MEEVVVPSINAEEGKNEVVELKEIKEPTHKINIPVIYPLRLLK